MTEDDRRVAFTPTLEDALAAQRLAARSLWWRYGFAAAACGVTAAIVMEVSGALPAILVAAFAIGTATAYVAMLALAWRFWFPRRVARHYRQQASLRQAYSVSWDDAGLLAETAQSRTLVRWPDYVRRREDAATVLLYQSDLLFQFLPKRAFTAAQMVSLRLHLDGVPAGRGRPRRAAEVAAP